MPPAWPCETDSTIACTESGSGCSAIQSSIALLATSSTPAYRRDHGQLVPFVEDRLAPGVLSIDGDGAVRQHRRDLAVRLAQAVQRLAGGGALRQLERQLADADAL